MSVVDAYVPQLGVDPDPPAVDLADITVSADTLALVPRAFAVRHQLVPLSHDGASLRVAIADPLELDGLDALGCLTGLTIVPFMAAADKIRAAIDRVYGRGLVSAGEMLDQDSISDSEDEFATARDGEGESDAAGDAPIIALVQAIIAEAVRRGASDIHLEPREKRLGVRYRIDGIMLDAEDPPKRLQAAIISRLKIMADISIAEKRIPQDGRIQVSVSGRTLDLRVSSLPTTHGESIVMRLLDRQGLQPGLEELGFGEDDRRTFERLLALPDGIVLVTGPTGSGKTTTLYSALHHLNRPDRKIITVEDPVEYQLAGINQVPVRPEIGMTFASALRAMLRQSPNVVMVGEIRDGETANIALNAALTGHMVFSTLHTNDAAGAITRLVDLGAKPFLVAASVRAVLAQRLVRRVCDRCGRPWQPPAQELAALNLTPGLVAGARFMKGAGCPACHGTGFRGRLGIFELLVIDPELSALVHGNASASKLREKARQLGRRSLREDGARKVTAGLTTVEEIVSITVSDPA